MDHEDNVWFSCDISLYDFSSDKSTDPALSKKLKRILKNAVRLNCEFLDKWNGFKVETKLEFPLNWGLGSSSTLIHLIAKWADVSPLELYFKSENGSGYDVVCAGVDHPIFYWSTDHEISFAKAEFNPSYHNNLYFVHLNQKKSSDSAIKEYIKSVKDKKSFVNKITALTEKMESLKKIQDFEDTIAEHEDIVAFHTGFNKVKDLHFSDYWGAVKSLGAWGGDFCIATSTKSPEEVKDYFTSKGFETVIPYKKMIL